MANESGGDVLNRERAEKELYPASGLPGGGLLELRMEVSADHPDPDIRGVGHGQKRFDRRTCIADWFMKQLKAG